MDNTFILISRNALQENIINLKSLLDSETKFFAVLKANAYGHGLKEVYDAIKNDVDGYAVHSLEEAFTLQNFGAERPILIMGYIPYVDLGAAIDNGFHFVIYTKETFEKITNIFKKTGKKPFFHLKVETGTGRQGIMEKDIPWFIDMIKKSLMIPTGIYTHFANIEDTTRHLYAMSQLDKFRNILNLFSNSQIDIPLKHTACSAAALLFPHSHFDMVRVGISLYGYWPSRETYLSFVQKYPDQANSFLRPALSWKTRIGQIKEMNKSSYIGYGLSFKTTYDSKIAVLPIGYYDGYDRGFSNNSYMIIKGERAPVRGRICMNITMIDVTHIPGAAVEEEVIIIGRQDDESITADDLASRINTINYELLCRIGSHIPRYLVD